MTDAVEYYDTKTQKKWESDLNLHRYEAAAKQ